MSNFLSQRWLLSRRHFLRGVGAGVALPLLNAMTPLRAADAAAKPRRSVFVYIPNGVNGMTWQVAKSGRDYELSPALRPLEKHRDDFTIFSGLHHPNGLGQAHVCADTWLTGAKIEAHRNDANCSACHRKIDPLGLAFESYDAIGHWRTEEAVRDGAGANPKLDPSGELPDGRKFADAAELKKLMLDDLDKFTAAFTGKLATYALRRGMTFDDRKSLAAVAHESKTNNYALSALIESLVLSDLFQKR